MKGRPLASFFRRAPAFVLDVFLLQLVVSLVGSKAFPDAFKLAPNSNSLQSVSQTLSYVSVLLLVTLGYFSLLASTRRGQTLGMLIGGICVRDARTGEQLHVLRALVRALVMTVLAIPLVPLLIDCLVPLWDARRQTLHDKAGGAVMVDKRLARVMGLDPEEDAPNVW